MSVRRLEAVLDHGFSRPELLRQALTHRSFAGTNNEQLEFLGDSVLDCAISASLCLRFPGEHRFRLHIAKMLFCPPAGATNPLE